MTEDEIPGGAYCTVGLLDEDGAVREFVLKEPMLLNNNSCFVCSSEKVLDVTVVGVFRGVGSGRIDEDLIGLLRNAALSETSDFFGILHAFNQAVLRETNLPFNGIPSFNLNEIDIETPVRTLVSSGITAGLDKIMNILRSLGDGTIENILDDLAPGGTDLEAILASSDNHTVEGAQPRNEQAAEGALRARELAVEGGEAAVLALKLALEA